MTALELLAPAQTPSVPSATRADQLAALLTPTFVEAVGWNPEHVSLWLEPGPMFRNHRCPSLGCHRIAPGSDGQVCATCQRQARVRGVSIEEIIRIGPESNGPSRGIPTAPCDVAGCGRIRARRRLCVVHDHRRLARKLSQAAYIASNPEPLDSFGECAVPACLRDALHRNSFCIAHKQRWENARRAEPNLVAEHWAANEPALDWDVVVSMRGVPELVRSQILVGLQKRIIDGGLVYVVALRGMIRYLQQDRYHDILDAPVPPQSTSASRLLASIQDGVRLTTATVETEVQHDVWDLRVFGLSGQIDFTQVTQTWLREALKHWATEVVGRLRDRFGVVVRDVTTTCRHLSETLANRADGGHDQSVLDRRDLLNHLNRLSRLERTGTISHNHRTHLVRDLRRFLGDCRDFRLTDPGQPLHGLCTDFVLFRDDIPQPPRDDATARDLPAVVMRALTGRLDDLAAQTNPDMRRITELLMDTGRRPDEICRLPFDCLSIGDDDKWVLVWTNFKANRSGRRLPIHDDTAAVIQAQQTAVLARYPATPRNALPLFPRDRDNPEGTFPISCGGYAKRHKDWVRGFPAVHEVVVETKDDGTIITRKVAFIDDVGRPFDPDRIQPYAYRHTYCQRHADQGTSPDVLKELLDHRSMETTQGYYRVREKRLRKAVDRVYASQVDGRGESVWSAAVQEIDDATRARLKVGEIAVPYGVCTEPSNVKAAGAACPYKFTCIACSHFRSDPSYLPELRSYHDRLLETRLRVRAASDLDEWAKDKVDPADEEIAAVALLVDKLERDASRLTDEDRSLLDRAVQLVRGARRSVDLGMPGRPAPADPRSVRTR